MLGETNSGIGGTIGGANVGVGPSTDSPRDTDDSGAGGCLTAASGFG
ncbi:MAG: hypothetical protein QGI88_09930 [SAR202 cluster bacterium]|nr:hypothetical protein [SAR202 cluster bacterium]